MAQLCVQVFCAPKATISKIIFRMTRIIHQNVYCRIYNNNKKRRHQCPPDDCCLLYEHYCSSHSSLPHRKTCGYPWHFLQELYIFHLVCQYPYLTTEKRRSLHLRKRKMLSFSSWYLWCWYSCLTMEKGMSCGCEKEDDIVSHLVCQYPYLTMRKRRICECEKW